LQAIQSQIKELACCHSFDKNLSIDRIRKLEEAGIAILRNTMAVSGAVPCFLPTCVIIVPDALEMSEHVESITNHTGKSPIFPEEGC